MKWFVPTLGTLSLWLLRVAASTPVTPSDFCFQASLHKLVSVWTKTKLVEKAAKQKHTFPWEEGKHDCGSDFFLKRIEERSLPTHTHTQTHLPPPATINSSPSSFVWSTELVSSVCVCVYVWLIGECGFQSTPMFKTWSLSAKMDVLLHTFAWEVRKWLGAHSWHREKTRSLYYIWKVGKGRKLRLQMQLWTKKHESDSERSYRCHYLYIYIALFTLSSQLTVQSPRCLSIYLLW